jgi:uncharacterized membrane protein YdfJ with MMPL/SSD domain
VLGAILDRVLRRPVAAALISGGILVALALPALKLHTAQTGLEGITSPSVKPIEQVVDAFPGSPQPAVVAVKADDVTSPAVQDAVHELKRKALASGEMNSRSTSRRTATAPSRGSRSRSRATARTGRRTARSRRYAARCCPRHWAGSTASTTP